MGGSPPRGSRHLQMHVPGWFKMAIWKARQVSGHSSQQSYILNAIVERLAADLGTDPDQLRAHLPPSRRKGLRQVDGRYIPYPSETNENIG